MSVRRSTRVRRQSSTSRLSTATANSSSTTSTILDGASDASRKYLAYSTDEEFEEFLIHAPKTDYTYARSASYNTVRPQSVGPPNMSRRALYNQHAAHNGRITRAAAAATSRQPDGHFSLSSGLDVDSCDEYCAPPASKRSALLAQSSRFSQGGGLVRVCRRGVSLVLWLVYWCVHVVCVHRWLGTVTRRMWTAIWPAGHTAADLSVTSPPLRSTLGLLSPKDTSLDYRRWARGIGGSHSGLDVSSPYSGKTAGGGNGEAAGGRYWLRQRLGSATTAACSTPAQNNAALTETAKGQSDSGLHYAISQCVQSTVQGVVALCSCLLLPFIWTIQLLGCSASQAASAATQAVSWTRRRLVGTRRANTGAHSSLRSTGVAGSGAYCRLLALVILLLLLLLLLLVFVVRSDFQLMPHLNWSGRQHVTAWLQSAWSLVAGSGGAWWRVVAPPATSSSSMTTASTHELSARALSSQLLRVQRQLRHLRIEQQRQTAESHRTAASNTNTPDRQPAAEAADQLRWQLRRLISVERRDRRRLTAQLAALHDKLSRLAVQADRVDATASMVSASVLTLRSTVQHLQEFDTELAASVTACHERSVAAAGSHTRASAQFDRTLGRLQKTLASRLGSLTKDISSIQSQMHQLSVRWDSPHRHGGRDVASCTDADSCVTGHQMAEYVERALVTYAADTTARFDFARESSGGWLVDTRCTQTYTQHAPQLFVFGIPIWYSSNNARIILQPMKGPGDCFAFTGRGHFVVALSHRVHVHTVVIEHVPRALTPHGRITSAPRRFHVKALTERYGSTGPLLGEFEFDQLGPPLQQFAVANWQLMAAVDTIELVVESNWGHPHYTCLYRLRVHGQAATDEDNDGNGGNTAGGNRSD